MRAWTPANSTTAPAIRAVGAFFIFLAIGGLPLPADDRGPSSMPDLAATQSNELWKDAMAAEQTPVAQDRLWFPALGPRTWTIDYRFRTLFDSSTSYEFGTPPFYDSQYTPLSRLNFPLDSYWHGIQLGLQKPTWDIHLEWLFPQQGIQGNLADYDWQIPNHDFTDLGYADTRWTDGQMLDLGFDFQLCEHPLGLPFELWPTLGFRWQRFNMMCYDGIQVKENDVWLDPPKTYPGDVISFNQQYYIVYLGGQFRSKLETKYLPPIALTIQMDWGGTNAYNVDHHLIREGDRYTMESTSGSCWHAAFTAEALISERFSAGIQADYLEIRTRGKHRWLNQPLDTDFTWDNGVLASSNQTWLTAFLRIRI